MIGCGEMVLAFATLLGDFKGSLKPKMEQRLAANVY